MKQFTDKNGKVLNVGDDVLVPEPNGNDIHNHEFVGSLEDILDDGTCIVMDGECDTFTIEHNRLEYYIEYRPTEEEIAKLKAIFNK